ncbi:SAM-dependent methyltransferase [Qipengyuania sp.]|uniref:SAM-dependent methyltransferase n=1 Tax=Qipengyuania sp. TaxID=2004515 RepID=UPI003AF48651
MDYSVTPIGHVRGSRAEAIDDDWGKERAVIQLDESRFGPEALAGLADFSHAEVVFLFDKVPPERIETGARHPRGRSDWPLVGIFAQRGKNRPNRIGLTTCRIIGVDGLRVEVEGLDAIDGTPVLDIKPLMREFLPRGAIRQPAWVGELMKDYW